MHDELLGSPASTPDTTEEIRILIMYHASQLHCFFDKVNVDHHANRLHELVVHFKNIKEKSNDIR